VLPGAKSAEGVAAGEGSTIYAGELFTGDIHRGDVRQSNEVRRAHSPGRSRVATPPALRKAVLDYAGPPGTPASQRRFAAHRFALATACAPHDAAVENELDGLQQEYHSVRVPAGRMR